MRNFDDERERVLQDEKYKRLKARVDEARRRHEPFELRTARQIALYIYKNEHAWRRINRWRETRLPIYHDGAIICLNPFVWEKWHELESMCAANGWDFAARLRDWSPTPIASG
jgi:hypothetical protein